MAKQKLNEKLAEWAGVKSTPMEKIYYDHTTEIIEELPNFTQSLDACFKWLVPKMPDVVITFSTSITGATIYCVHKGFSESYWAEAETPALALCLAINKLIESDIAKLIDGGEDA